ncbi:hypothetical protein C8J56DRAFT_1046123 [Mycena floridula]|nr:hypothetical protein C8J56DRAFT_1046123 [Mycena floridula]
MLDDVEGGGVCVVSPSVITKKPTKRKKKAAKAPAPAEVVLDMMKKSPAVQLAAGIASAPTLREEQPTTVPIPACIKITDATRLRRLDQIEKAGYDMHTVEGQKLDVKMVEPAIPVYDISAISSENTLPAEPNKDTLEQYTPRYLRAQVFRDEIHDPEPFVIPNQNAVISQALPPPFVLSVSPKVSVASSFQLPPVTDTDHEVRHDYFKGVICHPEHIETVAEGRASDNWHSRVSRF